MNFLPKTYRQKKQHSFREARLCFLPTPEVPNQNTSVTAWLQSSLGHAGESIRTLDLRGLMLSFGNTPAQEQRESLREFANFMDAAPPMVRAEISRLLRERVIREAADLEAISNTNAWLTAFATADVMDMAGTDDPPSSGNVNPATILKSKDRLTRRRIYIDFVDAFVPDAIHEGNTEVFGNDSADPEARFSTMDRSRIHLVMRYVMGEETAPASDPNAVIAEQILRRHYNIQRSAGPIALTPQYELSQTLIRDYRNAIEYLPRPHTESDLVDRARLQSVRQGTRFAGALRMGIITPDHLNQLTANARELLAARTASIAEVNAQREELMRTSARAARNESMSVMDIFGEMGMMERIALIAAAGYGISRFRGPAAMIAGLYFVRRFAFNDSAPLDTLMGMIRRTGRDIAETTGQTGSQELDQMTPQQRAQFMVQFLSEHDLENLTDQATGLSLLSEMRFSDIAGSFSMSGESWGFELRPGSALDRRMREENGGSTSYRRFFTEHRSEVADALSFVFYRRARETEDGGGQDAAVVSAVMSHLTTRHPFRELYDKRNRTDPIPNANMSGLTFSSAWESYRRLVSRGHSNSLSSNEIFGAYIRSSLGLSTGSTTETASETQEDRINQRTQEIHSYEYAPGRNAMMRVREISSGGEFEIGLMPTASGSLRHPIRLTRADFLSQSRSQILQSWRAHAMAERRSALIASPTTVTGLENFNIENTDNEYVLYSHTPPAMSLIRGTEGVFGTAPNRVTVARSSVYELWALGANNNQNTREIQQKLYDWLTRAPNTGDDEDPLE